MLVGIAADHGGFVLKEQVAGLLRKAGHEVTDFGAHQLDSDDDYPDFIIPLANAGEADLMSSRDKITDSEPGEGYDNAPALRNTCVTLEVPVASPSHCDHWPSCSQWKLCFQDPRGGGVL